MINSALWAKALLTPSDNAMATQPIGFEVYRNTVRKACIDALQANYPTVARVTGETWFRAAANLYVVAELPTQPSLMSYGQSFADFLQQFEPAQEMPYLYGLAKLDRCWTESHMAADALALDAPTMQSSVPLSVQLHPATRWFADPQHPIDTLWQRARAQANEDLPLDWHGEATLITRPLSQVRWTSMGVGCVAFLDACQQAQPLERSLEAAIAADPQLDATALLAQLIFSGALCANH